MTACFLLPSQVNNTLLITHGALSTLGLLLLDVAGAVQRTEDAGLELVGEKDWSRSGRPFFLLCSSSSLKMFSSSLHLTLQLVFAGCMPCASVSKQLANGGSSRGCGRANAARR